MFQFTQKGARFAITAYSIACTGLLLLFLVVAQLIQFPLNFSLDEQFRLIEMILPVFIGYLGGAANYIFSQDTDVELSTDRKQLLFMIVTTPYILFIFLSALIFVVFYYSNVPLPSGHAKPSAMNFNQLCKWFSIVLSLLTGVTSIVASYLFSSRTVSENSLRTDGSKKE